MPLGRLTTYAKATVVRRSFKAEGGPYFYRRALLFVSRMPM